MQLRATHSRGRASPSHNIRTLASGEDILRNRDVSTPKRCSMQHEATCRRGSSNRQDLVCIEESEVLAPDAGIYSYDIGINLGIKEE